MKLKIIKAVIRWLAKHYPYLMKDAVIPAGSHIQRNGKRRAKGNTFTNCTFGKIEGIPDIGYPTTEK